MRLFRLVLRAREAPTRPRRLTVLYVDLLVIGLLVISYRLRSARTACTVFADDDGIIYNKFIEVAHRCCRVCVFVCRTRLNRFSFTRLGRGDLGWATASRAYPRRCGFLVGRRMAFVEIIYIRTPQSTCQGVRRMTIIMLIRSIRAHKNHSCDLNNITRTYKLTRNKCDFGTGEKKMM